MRQYWNFLKGWRHISCQRVASSKEPHTHMVVAVGKVGTHPLFDLLAVIVNA